MIEATEQIVFACDEHKKCYETLLKIVKEGSQNPTNSLVAKLTEGVSDRVFHKSCLNTPWKKELSLIIKKESSNWEKNGGETAKKLKKAFYDMVKSGSKIECTIICNKAGVKLWNLRKYNLKYIWQKELYATVIKEQKKWEKYGGSDNRKGVQVLGRIIKRGEQPTRKAVILGMNKKGILNNQFAYPWQERLANAVEKAKKRWQRKGGEDAKKVNDVLSKYLKKGERPQINSICKEAGYPATNIIKPKYPWQSNIKTKIEKADQKWKLNGGKDGEKCREALRELTESQANISPAIVSNKAGFSHNFLSKNLFKWKLLLLEEIKEYNSKGLNEIHILYLDIFLLIEKIKKYPKTFNNYDRLGISISNPKTNIPNNFILSHIMYSSYNHVARGKNKPKLFVDFHSYKRERKAYIDGIIHACEGMKHSAKKELIPRMILAALWMEDRIPQTLDEARNTFYEYSIYLHRLLKSGEKKNCVCRYEQKGMSCILAGMFLVDETEIQKDYFSLLISQKAPASNAFSKITHFTQEDFSYTFSFYFHLFDQIADFLLKNKDYPYKIQLPRGHAIIMGLSQHPIIPYHKMDKYGVYCIDPLNGNILNDSELLKIANKNNVKYPNSYIKQKIKNLQKLEKLNTNKAHEKRLKLGKKALDAWFMCMLYLTGTNDSTLGTYEWSDKDEYETIHDERKEFITIKPRAMNKNIRFTIPKAFMASFQKAIRLRKFVLNGESFKYLFFQAGFGEKVRATRSQFAGGSSSIISREMHNFLDDELPLITSRDIRKDCAKDVINNYDINVALSVLQNNKSTLINNYNGFTAEELGLQINSLLDSIHKNVISEHPIPIEQKSSMGGCKNNEELIPKNYHDESPINANCNDSKTCIFCEHFITFPGKEEVRKLLSLQYVIENIAYDRAEGESFYEKEMKPWLKRIKVVLEKMIEKEPSIKTTIDDTKIEVYSEGLLSVYWLDWIEDLDELERLS